MMFIFRHFIYALVLDVRRAVVVLLLQHARLPRVGRGHRPAAVIRRHRARSAEHVMVIA